MTEAEYSVAHWKRMSRKKERAWSDLFQKGLSGRVFGAGLRTKSG